MDKFFEGFKAIVNNEVTGEFFGLLFMVGICGLVVVGIANKATYGKWLGKQ